MGHTRLGKIPKSKKWTAVVEAVTGSGDSAISPANDLAQDVEKVAKKTIEAAEGGLKAAINDVGLQYTFYLLTQISLAARDTDWQHRLSELGINLSDNATFHDLTVEM